MAELQSRKTRGPAIIYDMHSSGKSRAVFDEKNYYIDHGIPGEEVTFVSQRTKMGFRTGEVTEVLSPSPFRIEPYCLHHRKCNGCSWQHIGYNYQLILKHTILCNALRKYEISIPDVPPVIPSPKIHYYRHRTEYAFAHIAGRDILGFHGYGEKNEVFPIQQCFLQREPSRTICEFVYAYAIDHGLSFYDYQHKKGLLRSLSIRVTGDDNGMIVIGFGENDQPKQTALLEAIHTRFSANTSLCWTLHGSVSHSQQHGLIQGYKSEPYVYEKSHDYIFRVHANSFFQPNPLQADLIFETIATWADLQGNERVYDLYTGVGTIALHLAPFAGRITGIENSEAAISDARHNAVHNHIRNAEFLTGDILETFKPAFIDKHGKPDLIVLDPPRSGTLIEIKKTINQSGAQKVIYLSCNPVSLAFDLKQLSESYRITKIQPFDMLPHTHHLETLVLLEKKETR